LQPRLKKLQPPIKKSCNLATNGIKKTPPLGGEGEKSLYLRQKKMRLFIDDKEAPAE